MQWNISPEINTETADENFTLIAPTKHNPFPSYLCTLLTLLLKCENVFCPALHSISFAAGKSNLNLSKVRNFKFLNYKNTSGNLGKLMPLYG